MNIPAQIRRQTRLAFILLFLVITAPFSATLAFAQQSAPAVIVSKAEQVTLIEEVPLSGTVISPRVAKLSTEVSGIVETMNVEIGDRVKVGDVILRLNSELDELSLAAARAMTEQASQELEDAKRRLADAEALAKQQTVSANEIKLLSAEVRIDGATVERFRAEQQGQAALLRRHTLSAPFAGVISRKLVEQGEWIQPGDAVVELAAITGLRVDFQAPQFVYAKLDNTTEVNVKLDALPGQTFTGNIETVIQVTDPTTRTFLIRVALSDPEVKLMPGMSASAVLRLKTGTKGVVVPRDALMLYPDGRVTVWVVNHHSDNTTVSEHQVQTGLSFNGKVTITSGLTPDTIIVVQGNESLRDGQTVTVKHSE